MTQFEDYSEYYDAFNCSKDYMAEARATIGRLEKYGFQGRSLLEFGSGTGKHAEWFESFGLEVTGVEKSAMMAKHASSKGLKCHLGDITNINLGLKTDGIVSLFHVVSYLNTNQELLKLFENVNQHLHHRGLFLFDTWFSPAVYWQQPEYRKKIVSLGDKKIIREAVPLVDPVHNVVHVNYDFTVSNQDEVITKKFSEKHSMRHFSVPELAILASSAGLTLISVEDSESGAPPGVDSWCVTVVVQKI